MISKDHEIMAANVAHQAFAFIQFSRDTFVIVIGDVIMDNHRKLGIAL